MCLFNIIFLKKYKWEENGNEIRKNYDLSTQYPLGLFGSSVALYE